MAPIDLTDNINRIESGIAEFNNKMTTLKLVYDDDLTKLREEVCRLEGCRLVYTTLKEVYGDFIPSNNNVIHEEVGHDVKNEHVHGNGDDVKNEHVHDEKMSLSELYKKYRAM